MLTLGLPTTPAALSTVSQSSSSSRDPGFLGWVVCCLLRPCVPDPFLFSDWFSLWSCAPRTSSAEQSHLFQNLLLFGDLFRCTF